MDVDGDLSGMTMSKGLDVVGDSQQDCQYFTVPHLLLQTPAKCVRVLPESAGVCRTGFLNTT